MNKLAVYIHWPFCKSKCPYCDFNSHVRERVDQDRWRGALLKELETVATHVPGRTVGSIFFGGGTPSLMPSETAGALIERVRALWPTTGDIEITLEANPTSVETETFAAFKAAGVNRVSLGVQSLDDTVLSFLGRGHSAKEALAAVDRAAATFDRYSFDLIYARPDQTLESWERELTQALSRAGKHLSLYQLTIEENTAFHHAYAKGEFTLPDDDLAAALYRRTEDIAAAHGLYAYEVSNYAAPGQESRHNLSYWEGDDYIGIGPGAHGRITLESSRCGPAGPHMERRSGPAQSTDCAKGIRCATQTIKSPERWLEAVGREGHGTEIWQEVSREDTLTERVMMGLRLTRGIALDRFKTQTGENLADHLNAKAWRQAKSLGLLEDRDDRLAATLDGRLVLNRLTAELLG